MHLMLIDANRLQAFAACRKAYVASNGKMDFLADKVATVPDFAEEEAAPAKKQRFEPRVRSKPPYLSDA